MIKLFIIADDFTGALDTGVHFAADGAGTCVTTFTHLERASLQEGLEVLVVNAETRHLAPEKAYERVYALVAWAAQRRMEYIYKKTDSALRGHIGAELAAALDASGRQEVHFAPSYPEMNRTTTRGILYVDGTPVAESVFGQDPFNPVRRSDISGILQEETDIPVTIVPVGDTAEKESGILVYDAETDEELDRLCELLIRDPDARLLAGCAGFASALSKHLSLHGRTERVKPDYTRLLVACGSINPAALRQCAGAEKLGAPRLYTNRLDEAGIEQLFHICKEEAVTVLDTSMESGVTDPAQHLGIIVRSLLDRGLENTVFVVGGDSLWGVLQQLEVTMLTPLYEVMPGVVLAQYEYRGKTCFMLSKSGAFGGEWLFFEVQRRLTE